MSGARTLLDRFRESYLTKMLALFLVIAVAVAGSGLLMQGMIADELDEDVRKEVEVIGGLQADELDMWLESRRENTRMLSEFGVMTSEDTAEIDVFLEHEQANLPEEVTTLAMVDTESRTVVASPDRALEGAPVQRVGIGSGESLEFEDDAVRQTEPYIVDGTEYIAFLSPVPSRDDRVVVLTANLEVVADHVFQSPFDGGFTQVVGAGDKIVLDQRGDSTLQRYAVSDSEALRAGHAGEHGVIERDAVEGLLGERHLVQYAPVNGGEWVLMYHVPSSEAFQVADTVQQDIFILIGLFLAGLGMVGVVLHRYTVKPVTRLEEHVATLEQGHLDATAESGLGDEIGRLFDGVEALRGTIKERIETAEAATAEAREASREAEAAKEDAVAAQAEAEAAKQEAEALGEHLETKATEFGTTMAACADGDLTERLDPDSRSEAMTDVAHSFNAMLDEIEETVQRVQAFSEDVAAMSQQVSVSVEEIRDASEEVSESIVHIADGSADQNDRLLEMTDSMNDLSAAVEEISSSTDELSSLTQSAAADGERGKHAAEDAQRGMARIERETEDTVESIDALAEQLNRIGDIVDVITDIAEQTNILALNANIEAARAGEAGEGFAVVAAEVKSLAEETHSSVAEIGRIIEDVSEQREAVVEGMESMRAEVEAGSKAVDEAIGALDAIADKVEDTDVGVSEINRATDDQAGSAQQVLETADRVADISDETSAKAQNVSAAAQQQAASVGEVSDGVEHLAERTDDLEALLESFEVRRERRVDVSGAAAGATPAVTDGGNGPGRSD
jgi:methyl-accepting chemotaxis protein